MLISSPDLVLAARGQKKGEGKAEELGIDLKLLIIVTRAFYESGLLDIFTVDMTYKKKHF